MAKIKTRVTLRTPQAVALIKAASNEALTDMGLQALSNAVEVLGRAEIDMFEAVFGADGTETIQQFYKDRYGGLEGMIGMIDRSAPSVNVSVQGQSKDFDYEKFGRATVDAMIAAGIGFKCDDREFARLIKDLIDYV